MASLRERLDWFNRLRWGAALGVVAGSLLVGWGWKDEIELRGMLTVGAVLLLLNLLYVLRNRSVKAEHFATELRLVKLQMVGDLLALTLLLNFSGGAENPLLFLYIIHVIIGSLLFKGREIFQIAALAILFFSAEVLGEYFGWLPHHHLPLAGEVSHGQPFLWMTLGSFSLVTLFSAYIGAGIMKHNRAIKDELVARQGELLAEDRAKIDFFRFVTHEIKSPVHTAQSGVETALELNGDAMSATTRDLLQRSVRRLVQATDIIKDLAELTRRGVLKEENLTEVDLSEVVLKAVERQRVVASRRGQRLELELPEAALKITTSRSMVETIVMNLVSNAVRYNRDGGLATVRLQKRPREAQLIVEDEGIGIAPEDREKIFHEFYRSAAARENTQLGTGLGLSIVKKFVEGLGGSIEVESAVGIGSTFTVRLPRRKPA